ncbi:MAG: hypothetical protein MR008_05485 [Aerococcus sp.]|nr:hypothetical protein [Aerococcus sp.]
MNQKQLSFYNNQLVEIYSEAISDAQFTLGYLKVIDAAYSLVYSIDDYGVLESIQLRQNRYISDVVAKSDYLSYYRRLIVLNQQYNRYDPFQLAALYAHHFAQIDSFDTVTVGEPIYTVLSIAHDELLVGRVAEVTAQSLTLASCPVMPVMQAARTVISKADIISIDLLSIQNQLMTALNQ